MQLPIRDNRERLGGLRSQWRWYSVVVIICFVGGFYLLRKIWKPEYSWRWLVLSLGVVGYELWTLWVNLPANQRKGEEALLPKLGLGNFASLLRGALIAALYGFLFSPLPEGKLAWLPGMLYSFAALVDTVDGPLARITNHATQLGEKLDMYFDGLGMMVATGLLVQYGQVPGWYILIGLARYLFLLGMWLRERLGKVNYPMPPSVRRRWMAAVQMGFVSVMLLPVFSPPETHVISYAFGLPLLIGFLWDWLFVSGVIKPDASQRYVQIGTCFLKWVPVGLRLGVLVCSLIMLLSSKPNLISVINLAALALVTAGAAGRTASTAVLMVLGFQQVKVPLASIHMILGILCALILLLGSGALSLWKPEDNFVFKKFG